MFQLGFDAEAFGLIFASDYKAKVLAGEEGRATQATVEKFLEKVVSSCTDLSFSKDKILREFHFTDSEITYERLPIVSCSVLLLCIIMYQKWEVPSKLNCLTNFTPSFKQDCLNDTIT